MDFRTFLLALILAGILLFPACEESSNVDPCSNPPQLIISEVLNVVPELRLGIVKLTGSGASPLSYSLDGINFQTRNTFEDLPTGNYTAIVRDANDCTSTLDFLVETDELVSYSEDIRPILLENCMIFGCHCDGNGLCFQTYAVVNEFATRIAARTAGRAMPPSYSGKSLTEAEIKQIGDWVNQGALNN